MAIDIRMPKLSDNMTEGTILRWMKGPGDTVTKGEPLAEVETEKADVEVEASDSGVLREITVPEGQSAAVGTVIAVLAPPGEPAGDGAGAAAGRERGQAKPERHEARRGEAPGPRPPRAAHEGPRDEPATEPARRAEVATQARRSPAAESLPRAAQARISPLARRLAEDAGVDVRAIRGSGPGGRIVKRDIEIAMRGGAAPGRPAEPAADRERRPAGGEAERPAADQDDDGSSAPEGGERIVPASRMRLAIATRMAEAKRDIPHFYVTAEIDMSEAMHLRASIKRREAMPGLTVTHLLVRALAIALVRHPRVNASWREGGEIVLHEDVNIGIAVAVEDGLVVPVVHRAQTLGLSEIAARAGALTEKARNGKFGGDELTGGTFSLSNVGMLDIEELVAVINPPQAAILAVGAVKERPVVRDGQLGIAKTMRATLSCDHRVLNGIEGGEFLEELKDILENPVTLLLE